MKKPLNFLLMASLLSSRSNYEDSIDSLIYSKPRRGRKPQTSNEVIPKNHKHFSFRADGTYTCYEVDGPMLKSECVYSCHALNEKNAIKKFNKYSLKP